VSYGAIQPRSTTFDCSRKPWAELFEFVGTLSASTQRKVRHRPSELARDHAVADALGGLTSKAIDCPIGHFSVEARNGMSIALPVGVTQITPRTSSRWRRRLRTLCQGVDFEKNQELHRTRGRSKRCADAVNLLAPPRLEARRPERPRPRRETRTLVTTEERVDA
jgi:hypothetical protein